MPKYVFKCPNCEEIYEITAKFSEYDEVKKMRCTNPECDQELVRVYSGNSAEVFLPAESGFSRVGFIK